MRKKMMTNRIMTIIRRFDHSSFCGKKVRQNRYDLACAQQAYTKRKELYGGIHRMVSAASPLRLWFGIVCPVVYPVVGLLFNLGS